MRKWFFRKVKTYDKEGEKNEELKPFEERETVHALSMVFTIVNREQSHYFIDAYQKIGAAMSMVLYSYSMPPEEYRNILGVDSTKKEIVLTFCRSEYVSQIMKIAEDRFLISRAAKGIAFACPIDSVSGIAVYKFLADQNQDIRSQKNESAKK